MDKSQKIKIIIIFIGLVLFVGLVIFSFRYFQISNGIITNRNPVGEIHGILSGESYDTTRPDSMLLSGVTLKLVAQDVTTLSFMTKSNADGSFEFKKIPTGFNYLIKVENNQKPASYYLPYIEKVALPYGQKSFNIFPKLSLAESSLRDLKRQQGLYLYQSLLESYKTDNNHYPVADGNENIVSTESALIMSLRSYVNKIDFSVSSLIDPVKDRPFVYRSGGLHYWLNAYPEAVTDVALYNKGSNSYLIQH